jgi:tetrahydromethanopterin S-methyltransferase subunit B
MLSQPNIGGYQTSLDTLTMIWMTGSSLVLGAVFTAREYGIQWLERAEKARIKVSQNIHAIKDLLDESKQLINKASSEAPSINMSPEAKNIEETESTINDFMRGLSTASYETLNQWIEELEKVLTPRTKSLPEAIRVRVMGELNYLVSLVVTYNNILREVGLKKSFSESAETYGDLQYNQALIDYSKLLNDVKTNSNEIFNMYKDTFNAFNTVTSQLDVRPPVDPTRLFESNDYEGGIKLLAEEYWLGFHVKNQSELESLVASLSAKIEGLTLLLDEQTGQKLRLMNEKLARSKPVDSLLILEEVKNLKQIIDGVLNEVSGEITQIQKLVDSFPGTTKVIPFEVYSYSTRLQSLKLRNLNAKSTIRDSVSVVEELTEFLKYYGDSKKADESNLIVISQLPVAMKIIKNELTSKKTIEISSLPFQHRAAQIYAAYYVNNNPKTRYDDEKEVLGTHA